MKYLNQNIKTLAKHLVAAGLGSLILTASAFAQVTTTTPGVPSTSGGDVASNILLIMGSALIILTGTMYLSKKESGSQIG
jgi:hypothetical protein